MTKFSKQKDQVRQMDGDTEKEADDDPDENEEDTYPPLDNLEDDYERTDDFQEIGDEEDERLVLVRTIGDTDEVEQLSAKLFDLEPVSVIQSGDNQLPSNSTTASTLNLLAQSPNFPGEGASQFQKIRERQSTEWSKEEAKGNSGEVVENEVKVEETSKPQLEAKQIYVLMSKEYRISRNRRAEWFFSNVNKCLNFPQDEFDEINSKNEQQDRKQSSKDLDDNGSSDFEVVSIIPLEPPPEWNFDYRHAFRYHVNPDTVITYLSRRYRIVFCLDISPSVASVDVQAGGVVFDNIFKALQTSLNGLLQPFQIPGSKRTFQPEVFLTVIAHTPFFTPVTDQVLIQGQILEKETCSNIVRDIFHRLNDIENKIAGLISNRVHELSLSSENDFNFNEDSDDEDQVDGCAQQEDQESNGNGNGFDEQKKTARPNNSKYSSFSMSPDFGLLDLLRQALIALSLMPENSSAGLVILTDGVISVPDGRYLDIILSQLRYNTVSCSFIQLSSPFHPHLCHGVLPYADLMKFIASATFGAFLSEAPEIDASDNSTMNVYHNAFLAWSFHKTLETEWFNPGPPTHVKPGEWSVRNKCFFSVRDMPIVKKQQYENTLHVDHMKVMSCRLREGFTIKEVITSEGGLSEVTLMLPWKFLIHLEYKILINIYDELGLADVTGPPRVRCAVSLEGPYDFLHDVTCLAKKPFSSLYRQLMVNRFWATRKNLSESDRLLVHLNSFSSNPAYYNIPESLKNGMPLFYWGSSTNSAIPQLMANELSYPQFTHFWKPVCLLDTTVWQKWMHTHRIGVILEHDYPLPKNLHLPNSTGRFNVIQCRQAIMALNTLLKNMSSFVLLENQSYVHLMFKNEEEKVPNSFCLIRVTSKPPHVVLRLAFLVGTPGHLRHRTVAQFREKITTLTFPQRVKDPPKWRVIMTTPVVAKAATTASPLVNKTAWSEMPCCLIVHKPVEKILIKYDKCPDDFRKRLLSREETSMYIPEGKSGMSRQSTFGFRPTYQATPVGNTTSYQMLPEVFNTIARYLHHKRWIWWFPGGDLPPLNTKWASEILATVTKMRLQEGFRFAYSSAGITNMVLELPMKNVTSRKNSVTPMVLQFLVFPPTSNLQNEFEDFDSFDANNSLYLVTECWVEPQCGIVSEDSSDSDVEDIPVVAKNFVNLDYTAIPKLMFETDYKCISLVGTFEYLVRICSHKEAPFLICVNQSNCDKPIVEQHETIDVVPFEFNLWQILMRSGQIEILFSSFFQDLSLTFPNEWNSNVSFFFERANSILYQQWCSNISSFQDKEVQLSDEQHDAATRAVLQRKGLEDGGIDYNTTFKAHRRVHGKGIQWRCFVRSSSSTHVLLTLIPTSLKDMKQLLLIIDPTMENLHKTKSSRYVDFLDLEGSTSTELIMECPNQAGTAPTYTSSASSSSSPHLADHHQQNCRTCQSVSRKRVRAFSGGSECAPAVKKYLAAVQDEDVNNAKSLLHHAINTPSEDSNKSSSQHAPEESISTRSQTFSEGTVSGKLAQFMRTKRTLSDASGGTGGDEEQEVLCSDPQRCIQLKDYLNRCGHWLNTATDDKLRFVPCRPPVIGSMAYCSFTYSCSLMTLTDHVVFKKVSRDEMTKDFRVSRNGTGIPWEDYDADATEDDDDDLSTGSGSIFPNGRSNSQESFSESSLQRLEAAEHDSFLKAHCNLLKGTHLQAYIWSAYRSLLSGYSIHPCDIQVVLDRCTLCRVRFPLDNFLKYVCRHDKKYSRAQQSRLETETNVEEENSTALDNCKELQAIHLFIKKRFRRLIARNFTAATDNGHFLFYKIAGSNALSDLSGHGGPVKCSSDLEDNLDSCSIVADSLCSEEPYPLSSLHIPSDNETTDRSPGQTRVTTATTTQVDSSHQVVDDQQSCGGMTAASIPASSTAVIQYVPLFCYFSCGFQTLNENKSEEDKSEDNNYSLGCIPLTDIPTCHYDLCREFSPTLTHRVMDEDANSDPSVNYKLVMELTFLTSCDSSSEVEEEQQQNTKSPKKDDSNVSGKAEEQYCVSLSSFKKRLSVKQSRAIDQTICDIEWLMEDEITSFRGGGSGSIASNIDADILLKICRHVEYSLEKPGCQFQQIPLHFVEHLDQKGFNSFLDRFNNISVNEYSFMQVDQWWYLVSSRSQGDDSQPVLILPPFWIIIKAQSPTLLQLYYHCRYDENDLTTLTFSRNLRVRVMDLISNLVRTINQDLLLQQLHDTRLCSPLLEVEDPQDLEETSAMADLMMIPPQPSKFIDSESDLSLTHPVGNFCPGMFSCQVVWVTTFNLHSRLRSGGGKTAFARGIQTLRSTLTAFEVINRKNMFVYRDAAGNVFYMRFYRGVDVLEGSNNSPSKMPLDASGGVGGGEDYPESELTSLASDSSSVNRIMLKRARNNDSESEKTGRDDAFDGILALKVHGIVPAGEEIKEKLVQSLRNKLDDAVLDILSVTLKRNPHCKLTPEDVHFLQEPRSRPDSVFRFKLTKFVVSGHLPAFSYYLHQNLLQLLSMPKYTSQKTKYHFQDYSRLQEEGEGAVGESSLYLFNQSPGGGGTGNRGIAIVSMALVDRLGNIVRCPEWRQPQLGTDCDVERFESMIESKEIDSLDTEEDGVIVEFNLWKQGRINLDLLKGYVDQAIKHAGWDLIMEFKIITAPLAKHTNVEAAEDDGVFENLNASSGSLNTDVTGSDKNQGSKPTGNENPPPTGPARRRRSSHLNPTRSNSTSGTQDETEEPRTRSMSFTGLRKPTAESGDSTEQSRDRAPSPVTLISGRGASEGSRPRVLLSRTQSNQMSLTRFETGEVGQLHSNYTSLLDSWLENGINLNAPSLRQIVVPLHCRYPVKCIVIELEKIINQVAPDNTPRQFWQHGDKDYISSVSCVGRGGTAAGSGAGNSYGSRRDSCGDEFSASNSEYCMMKRYGKELVALEDTEEAEYPYKILNLFRRNEKFQPSYKGHVCYLVARNLAHWKSCLNCNVEFALHSSQDFKNFYKYSPLLNENLEMNGSHGSIEKLSRSNYAREFILWNGGKNNKSSIPILIPRQRFLRAKVTCSEVDFVVYNWSKECCERLQEQVNHLSHWIQARANLLTSVLLQKSGLFYCQPIIPENFASSANGPNPFLAGDVDIKDLILNTPSTGKFERRNPITAGRLKPVAPPNLVKTNQTWKDFYRNVPLRNLLGIPEPVGENPVDAHGKQLLHVLNIQGSWKEPEPFFQYWLTRGPSASNVITTQVLESFTQTARTIHFCLTPVMFLPTWRAAVSQTRDSSSVGGIIRRNRGSSRRHIQSLHPSAAQLAGGKQMLQPPAILQAQRTRHGSEASQASSLSLRNRSKSYHSGMAGLFMHPEAILEKELDHTSPSPQQQQLQNLFLRVKADEPWHGVLCRTFLQEYMQYLQTLGFVPVHCKASPAGNVANSPTQPGSTNKRSSPMRNVPTMNAPLPSSSAASTNPTKAKVAGPAADGNGNMNPTNVAAGSSGINRDSADTEGMEEDERMIHFLQRCLPGGIMVIEVGLVPPFFYCKIHALEAKRIFPLKNNKLPANVPLQKKNAIQFVDECENMKVLTHLHSFMYDFHLRAMYLYISGRQLLFKMGYHITTFLDDFITYYPKCPNFSRNAVHIGVVTLEEVNTPSQVLFNYILSHDKYYRMKVIRMTPFSLNSVDAPQESSSEYVLVHNMSRKVSYRSSDRGEDQTDSQQQTQDEFDLTLVIAHDYPTSSRDFVPDYQGLRVKYYIVLTSRRELYPKGDAATTGEPHTGKMCKVTTPEPLCSRYNNPFSSGGAQSKLVPPPAPPPSFFEGFESHFQSHPNPSRKDPAFPDSVREECVHYMGYFSSHEQLMQKIIDEQQDTIEQFIKQLITKAAVDCRRDLLWQRLLIGKPQQEHKFGKSGKSGKAIYSAAAASSSLKEDIISRETVGPLYYWDFNELLGLVQIVPLQIIDPRLDDLLRQPVSFYQTLIKVLIAASSSGPGTGGGAVSNLSSHGPMPSYNYREFVSPDHQVHQLAIFSQDAHKSIIMIEVNIEQAKCDIYMVFKDGKKAEQGGGGGQQQSISQTPPGELGDAVYSLVEKIVNACCYATWTTLI